ncbi:MAG TPA: hypothetical protein VGD05_12545 [Pyrinomonadaceae bacterium]
MSRYLLPVLFILMNFLVCNAQTEKKPIVKNSTSNPVIASVKSSAAFAEIILRKTELEAELESLLINYTEEFPKVKEMRFESDSLKKAIGRLAMVKSAEAAKLTLALGKLMVRKAELETDLWNLLEKYDDNHPEVKRVRRKIEIYESAIKEILG